MAHIGNQFVMYVALGVTIAIPLYMWRRKRNVLGGLDAFVQQRGMRARTESPVAAFSAPDPPEGLHFSSAFDGQLRPGVPMTLLLLRRTEAVFVQGVSVQNATVYVGAYLPTQVDIDPNVLKDWQMKAQRQQEHVVFAARTIDSGFVVVWKGTPSRDNVEARLAELSQSLPTSRKRSA
jgi:hypothetical protein